jgi:hypothetical protein
MAGWSKIVLILDFARRGPYMVLRQKLYKKAKPSLAIPRYAQDMLRRVKLGCIELKSGIYLSNAAFSLILFLDGSAPKLKSQDLLKLESAFPIDQFHINETWGEVIISMESCLIIDTFGIVPFKKRIRIIRY